MGDEEEQDDGEEQEDVDLQVYNDGDAAACWATNSPRPPTTKAEEIKKKERKKGRKELQGYVKEKEKAKEKEEKKKKKNQRDLLFTQKLMLK